MQLKNSDTAPASLHLSPTCVPLPSSSVVAQLLTFHEKKYMVALWQTECTAYMRRYERADKPMSSFMADIQKYLDLKEEVRFLARVCDVAGRRAAG